MKLGHLEIFVREPLQSKEFYEKILGFEVIDVQHEKYVWMKSDGTHILLRPGKNYSKCDTYASSNFGFVIYTDDLEKSVSELTSRGLRFKGNDGSSQCPTFTDPDGNWFQLVNPQDH